MMAASIPPITPPIIAPELSSSSSVCPPVEQISFSLLRVLHKYLSNKHHNIVRT